MSLISVLDLGMTGTITRYYSKYDEMNNESKQNEVLTISRKIYNYICLVVFVFGGILYIFFSNIYAKTLTSAEFAEAKIILLIIIINAIVLIQSNIYIAIIQAKENFLFQRAILLLRTLIVPFLAAIIVWFVKKSFAVFAVHLLCNFFLFFIYRSYCKKYLKIKFENSKWNSMLAKEIFNFAFFLFLNTIVDELYWNTDSMILGAIGGTAVITVYGTANTIITQFRGFSSVIHGLFLPRLTKLATIEKETSKINLLFLTISQIQIILVFWIYSGFLVFGKDFVTIWAGKDYSEAYNIAMITMTALVVPLTQSLGISILRAYNKQKFRAILYIILAICNVILSMPAAYYFQGYGCATVTAIFLIIGNIFIMNIYYKKVINLDMGLWWRNFYKLLWPVIVCTTIGIFVKKMFILTSLLQFSTAIFLYSVLYSMCLWFLGFRNSDRKKFYSFLSFLGKKHGL